MPASEQSAITLDLRGAHVMTHAELGTLIGRISQRITTPNTLKEHPMSKIIDELKTLTDQLKTEGHHLADRFHAALAKLHGDEQRITQQAQADAEQLKHDAAPVVAEAEHDATQLATEAKTDIKDATQPPAGA